MTSISYDLKEFNYRIENNKILIFEREIDPIELLNRLVMWQDSPARGGAIIDFNELVEEARKCVSQRKFTKQIFESVNKPTVQISPISAGNVAIDPQTVAHC